MAGRHRILSMEDRETIAKMWLEYQPVWKIAKTIGFAESTIYREIKRGNKDGELDENMRLSYDPKRGQAVYHANFRRRGTDVSK